MRLILWDIDGTLLRSGGVALDAFNRAVERALGRHPGEHGVSFQGGTDPQIALEILAVLDVAEHEARRLLPAVLGHLEAELAAGEQLMRERGFVMPGVPEVLARLHDDLAVHQSVLTGNTAANAAVKLRASSSISGSMSRSARSAVMTPTGIGWSRWRSSGRGACGGSRSLRTTSGWWATPCATWHVPEPGGARCLLVATGQVEIEELRAAGPDALYEDLSDVDGVCWLLTGQT